MGWIGPNNRLYEHKRWFAFAAITAACAAAFGWMRARTMKGRRKD